MKASFLPTLSGVASIPRRIEDDSKSVVHYILSKEIRRGFKKGVDVDIHI